MKKIFLTVAGAIVLLLPSVPLRAASEIHVTKDGVATISNAKVMQIIGSTFYTRLYWGDSFARFTIRVTPKTQFLRATGEQTTIAEISEGDILDASGQLETQSSSLTLIAAQIKNSSVQKEQATFSGTTISVDLSDARQFLLNNKERGVIAVTTATTTQFLKGTRTIDLEHLRAGDRITKVTGDYDLRTKKLVAKSVVVYSDPTMFKPKNFTGKLVEVPTAPDASLLKVSIDKKMYTIYLNSKTLILNNKKSTTTLQRFISGDAIRLYGAIREVDDPIIDAEVIRNTNL